MNDHHGRVRFHAGDGWLGEDCIGITLGNTDHRMDADEALALANRIILTYVDHEERLADAARGAAGVGEYGRWVRNGRLRSCAMLATATAMTATCSGRRDARHATELV